MELYWILNILNCPKIELQKAHDKQEHLCHLLNTSDTPSPNKQKRNLVLWDTTLNFWILVI
jgi:hypothetical protein